MVDIRRGYHMITHFQCNLCHFRSTNGRDLTDVSHKDERLLIFIRRVLLVIF